MNIKEHYLDLLNIKVPNNLMHYNLNIYDKKDQDNPEIAMFTNTKGNLVLRFNPWDKVDGVKIVR